MRNNTWVKLTLAFIPVFVLSMILSMISGGQSTKEQILDWSLSDASDPHYSDNFDRSASYARNIWGIEEPEQFFIADETEDLDDELAKNDGDINAELNIKLLGIINDNKVFAALIQLKDGDVLSILEGMEIQGYVVEAVDIDRVILVGKNNKKKLTLFE